MHELLLKIGVGIVGILTALGIYQAPIDLGNQLAVGGENYYLGGSGIGSTDNTINLTKFGYTKPDGTYQKFNMTNFGDLGCGTVQPGNNKGKQEFVSFTDITQNSDGTAQLTGVSRGLERYSPYSASTTLQTNHPGGSSFVVSNSPPCFYENYVTINNDETITSVKTFASTTYPQLDAYSIPTNNLQFITKQYADALAFLGVATATESTIGATRLATMSQASLSTASSTGGAPLCLLSRYATSTPTNIGWNFVPITNTSGKLNQFFWDLTQAFAFSGSSTFSGATTTLNSEVVIPATIAKPLRVSGQSYIFPIYQNASSSILKTDGSGTLIWDNESWEFLGEFSSSTASKTITAYNLPARKLLRVYFVSQGAGTADEIRMKFNGDVGKNYGYRNFEYYTQLDLQTYGAQIGISFMSKNTASSTNFIIDINNYATSTNATPIKFVYWSGGSVDGDSLLTGSGSWRNTTTTINRIDLYMVTQTFNAESYMYVYGSKQ